MLKRDILAAAIVEILPEIQELRKALHAIPETAGREIKTRELLVEHIKKLRPILWQPKLQTDVVCEIPGRDPGKVIGIRADMDGLPLQEKSRMPYSSIHEGVMHACGHDGHMAILLGTAMVLSRFQDKLPCTVRCIFQPGEEEACLGAELTAKGVCDGLSAVYGFHNWPGLPVGAVSAKAGTFFAAANTFTVKFVGKGTHGATPEKGKNPIPTAARAVGLLQKLHDQVFASDGSVVSVCSFSAGMNSNVIPSETVLRGTTRYIDKQIGDVIEKTITDLLNQLAREDGLQLELVYDRKYYLPVVNTPEEVLYLQRTVEKCLGEGAYREATTNTMTAEDFAFYVDKVPGCMFWLGAGEDHAPLHAGDFDFNDDALFNGILVLAGLAFGSVLD